jgi:hypothetical protein
MSSVRDLAWGWALHVGSRRGTGIYGHPACRLFGETPVEFADRAGPFLEREVEVVLELLMRRLPPWLAARVGRALGLVEARPRGKAA